MFQVLVALAGRHRHGYAIMQEVERRSGGAFTLGPGTLYRTLKRLLDDGLIAEIEAKGDVHQSRRAYRITRDGRRKAQAEARRLSLVLGWAIEARLLDEGRRT